MVRDGGRIGLIEVGERHMMRIPDPRLSRTATLCHHSSAPTPGASDMEARP